MRTVAGGGYVRKLFCVRIIVKGNGRGGGLGGGYIR